MLSPLTFWNDAFINIPISYIAASLLFRFIHAHFTLLVVICYWISNAAGLWLMFISGKSIVREGRDVFRELPGLVLTMAAYTVILFILIKYGILKPI